MDYSSYKKLIYILVLNFKEMFSALVKVRKKDSVLFWSENSKRPGGPIFELDYASSQIEVLHESRDCVTTVLCRRLAWQVKPRTKTEYEKCFQHFVQTCNLSNPDWTEWQLYCNTLLSFVMLEIIESTDFVG